MPRYGSFLQRSRHGTVYYFRRRIPAAIQALTGRSFVYRSLSTSDKNAALVYARALAVVTDRLFAKLMRMTKKGQPTLKTGYELEIELEEFFGKPGKVRIKADTTVPGDHDAAKEALNQALDKLAEANQNIDRSLGAVLTHASARSTKKLGEAIDFYLANAGKLKPASRKTYTTALKKLVLPFFGHETLLGAIDQVEFARFVGNVNSMDRAFSTKEGYVVAFSSFGKWYRNRGEKVPDWKAAGLLEKRRMPPDTARDAFTFDELEVVLRNAASYLDTEPAKFWVTAICALSGCRVEELAQIDLSNDLRYDDVAKVHFLKLSELSDEKTGEFDPHKSLKASASWRVIPIHSRLVELGAVDYLKQQASQGYTRPFESQWPPHEFRGSDVEKPILANKWSHKISKWGGRELKKLVAAGLLVKGKKTYFHSVRHTFITHLASRDVPQEKSDMLTGHQTPGESAVTYNKLRNDAAHLSRLVEANLDRYVSALNEALKKAY